jgi:hypothetical protein
MRYLRSLFGAFCADEEEVEARCMIAMSLWVASPLIAADRGAHSPKDGRALVVARLLS